MAKKANADDNTLYLRPVPALVKADFKAGCARFGVTMTDAHVEFMRQPKLLPDIVKAVKLRKHRAKSY